MIDIHTHILPNIDDGSASIDETFQMIHEAYDAGFTDICMTSHYIEEQYEMNMYDRECIIQALQEKLNKEETNVKLYNGAEAYISEEIPNLVEDGIIPTLADSEYILFELPLNSKVMYTDDVIERFIGMKNIPVIAHPERYRIVQEDPNIAIDWVKQGALLQSNYASIIGKYGSKTKETLLKLLDANAIHLLGTDTHRKNSIYTKMDEILKEFKKKIGYERLRKLSEINPKKVIENIEIEEQMPKNIKSRKFFR